MASSGIAHAFPDSLAMSCDAARRAVQGLGAVILNTGPDVFNRYVTSGAYCEIGETTDPAWVATKDNPQCLVGRRCRQPNVRTR